MIDNSDAPIIVCPACEDTGFIIRPCGGNDALCGRKRRHFAHEWADPCPCRPMNYAFQAKHGRDPMKATAA